MPDNEFAQIPIERIGWPSNDRTTFDPEQMAGLVQSVKAHGVMQPIGVIPDGGGYRGLWGQRRLMAAKAAGLAVIPALIQRQPRTEAEALEKRLSENVQREALTPVELAMALDRLIRTGESTAAEVALKLGMSGSAVSRSLALLKLPPQIREQVGRGISAAAAYELASVEDPQQQAQLAGRLAAGELTRDGLSGELKRGRKAIAGKPAVPTARVTALLGGGRAVTVSGSSLTLDGFVECLEEVLAKARKARPQGIEINTFIKMLKDQAKA